MTLLACLALLAAWPTPAKAAPSGGWTLPIDPPLVVVRGFDPPAVRWLAGHRGVDLAAAEGATVRASGPGIVSYAGLVAGKGVVVISHTGIDSGLRTTYEPVTASVLVGQSVAAGEPIGVVAAASGHCSPAVCLHWGLRRGDTYLDPLRLVAPVAVRLLPLEAAHMAVSGPRMGLVVSPAQPFDRYVGIDLGGRQ
jgi:murein DD-endopeptidase MepM/ murein hydrolase activator NlpD